MSHPDPLPVPQAIAPRPDLDQLRRRAKELRDAARQGGQEARRRFAAHHPSAPLDAPGGVSLAAAQLVIAREAGFPSWPRLKAAVDAELAERHALSRFLAASVGGGGERTARAILRADPGLPGRSLLAATVLGEAGAVRERLAADPGAALAVDEERGWPPLLYACHSAWHRADPDRAPGLAEVVRLLLAAGAGPNTNDGGRPRYRSALKGAVEADNGEVAEILLAAGADPNAGQPVVEAVGREDRRCLRALLARGARVAGTWAIGAAVFHDDAVALTLLLDALRAGGGDAVRAASEALPEAAGTAGLPLVAALLDSGADPAAVDGEGVSAYRHAVRAGHDLIAARLRELGAADAETDVDRFLGACRSVDRATAARLLADSPDLVDRLTDEETSQVFDAASHSAEALALLLDLGFPPGGREGLGEAPLHSVAYAGNAAGVRLLLAAGAEVDAHDTRFDGTPLAFATVGSGEQAGRPGDWPETVRVLLAAGASREHVWVPQKPPSEEVAQLLRSLGIGPDRPEPAGPAEEPRAADTVDDGVLSEIAGHLEAACRDQDLELFASVLDPRVTWTGLCRDRSQVLDWFRSILADGTRPTLRTVEIHGDSVVLDMDLSRPAEGARPAPPQRFRLAFVVDGDRVVEIRRHGSD